MASHHEVLLAAHGAWMEARLGRLVALHDFGAGEIAEVKPAKGASVMLPFAPDFVPEIDLDGGRVVIDPPDGLLEMAAESPSKDEADD